MIKKLYSFEVSKDEEVEVEEIVANADGSQTITKRKEKKSVPYKFCIKKPTRTLREEVELFRGRKFAEATKSGLLPAALISKRLINDEGIFSETEKDKRAALEKELYEIQAKIAKINVVPEKDRNDDQKKESETLSKEIGDVRTQLATYEAAQLSVYDNSVEVYVRNKTIFFYTLFLACKEDGDKITPFFGEVPGKNWEVNYDAKLKKYDEYEELNDPFTNIVINKSMHIVTIWLITGEEREDELKKLIEPVEVTAEKVTHPPDAKVETPVAA